MLNEDRKGLGSVVTFCPSVLLPLLLLGQSEGWVDYGTVPGNQDRLEYRAVLYFQMATGGLTLRSEKMPNRT